MEISTDERFASSLQYIQKHAGGEMHKIGHRHKLVTGTRNTKIIIDALAEIIVTDCKAFYICERIKLPIDDELKRQAFIRALSIFDRDTDKLIAKTLIKVTPSFCLDSFYEFMLDVLKSRWDEVCTLANENICYLLCQKTFLELLRFLISNIESISDEAHIMMRGTEIEILGRGLKPLGEIYVNESLSQDVQIVSKLVTIAPKRIFLHPESIKEEMLTSNKNCISDSLMFNIKSLFGTCIVIN